MDQIAAKLTSRIKVITELSACFSIGHVVTMCCVHTPALAPVFLGHLNQACVYTIPDFPTKTAKQSVKEYQLSLGFEMDPEKNDAVEPFTKYSHRMMIAMGLYAAICQTSPWHQEPQAPGLALTDLWQWMQHVLLKIPPQLMTATLVTSALEVAGFELQRSYPQDMPQLMAHVQNQILPKLSKDAKTGAAAAAARLVALLKEYYSRGGNFVEPEGRVLKESEVTEADEDRVDGEGGGGGGRYTTGPVSVSAGGTKFGGGRTSGGGRGRGGGGRRGGGGYRNNNNRRY